MSSGRTAFVLTGGGSLGAVQVGMMAALHEQGIDPDLLVGTSVGAVNAAYVAGPGTTGKRLASLAAMWSAIRRRDVFVFNARRWLRATTGTEPSMFSGEPLRRLLTTQLGYDAFEDSRLELVVTATDVVTGVGLILDSGPVVDAVAASAAVPGVLPPVWRGNGALVDGAVGHAATLAHADARGVDDIYLLPAGYPCAGAPPRSALGVALTALSLLLHRQLVEEVRSYAGSRARLHVVPPLCPLAIYPGDFSQGDYLIRRARASTHKWLNHTDDQASDVHLDGDGVLALHGPHLEHGLARPATEPEACQAPTKGRPT